MLVRLLDHQDIYVRSMGKALRILALATSDKEANDYCEKYDAAAVIAEYGKTPDSVIFIADKYDHGTPIPRS